MPDATFAIPDIRFESRPDGTSRMWSAQPLGRYPRSVAESFRDGSDAHPERLLLAERTPAGWHRLTWGEARDRVDRLAQSLLDRDLADRPLMLLSQNGIGHLLLTLAGYTLGVPVVPVSVAYSLQSRDHATLRAMTEMVDPGVVFAADPVRFADALAAVGPGRQIVVEGDDGCMVTTGSGTPEHLAVTQLVTAALTSEVDACCARISPDDIAKILFTSGSTGTPKGVLTTHRMLTANQQQIREVWPFLTREPPVLLDWLPWSHTFGGNHNLGMVLANGGSMWIDDGRPTPELIDRTVANLGVVSPTIYFNVPAGYAALVPILERDDAAARRFFAALRLGFFAAAALPQQLWDRLQALATRHGSSMRMTTSWGLTETSPAATTTHFVVSRSDCLGVPLPGVELKLVPTGDKTEVRLRGPNVSPGFLQRPDLTAAAFDHEGYLCTGDAVALADPGNPDAGLTFRGRIAEDFKLSTGTFVSVGTLRPALLSAAGGLLQDAVICGQDADFVAALVWLHADHTIRCDADGAPHPDLRAELRAALIRLADAGGGSSQRIERLLVLSSPPAIDAGEITDKGYINQRAARECRAAEVVSVLAEPVDRRVVTRQPGPS